MTHEVISVRESIEGNQGVPCWRLGVREISSGLQREHLFPKNALEWRAAEYGVDPTDIDTLLTMILHEPHLEQTVPGFVNAGETNIWLAANATEARESHLKKIRDNPVNIPVKGNKLLDTIRGIQLDKAKVLAKMELVDTLKWAKRYGDLPLPSPTGTPSHPKAPIADSMGVTLKAKESLTVIVGGGNGPDQR